MYFQVMFLMVCQLSHPGETQKESVASAASEQPNDESVAVVVGSKVLNTEGDWRQSQRLRAYAISHPVICIIFALGALCLLQIDSAAVSDARYHLRAFNRLVA